MDQFVFDIEAKSVQELIVRIQQRNGDADPAAGVRGTESSLVPDDLIDHVDAADRLSLIFQGQPGASILDRNQPAKAHFRHAKRLSTRQAIRRKTESLLPIHQVDPFKFEAHAFQSL